MKRIFTLLKLKALFYPGLLFILVVSLFVTNYTKGTWLTGWDNLHPEFNFIENIINRSILGVWQEYQGFGILTGNAHSADLVRQVFMLVMSFVLPSAFLRYFYHFLMLYVGSLGVYFFLYKKVFSHSNSKFIAFASFVGGLFYILNPGTMQYFYVPFEAFSHFYAFFPWLLFSTFNYLDSRSKKTLLYFIFVNILATPAFYVPTIFVVYFLALLCVFLIYFLFQKREAVKGIVSALTLTLVLNSFWLLPFIYFFSLGTSNYTASKINRSFTTEASLRNQQFGNIQDLPMFKGFLVSTTDLVNSTGTHKYMLQEWITHLQPPFVIAIFYIFFIGAIAGVILGLKARDRYMSIVSLLFGIGVFVLIGDNFPTGFIFRFLQNYVPLFQQIFRLSFTKFIVMAVFSYSVLLGYLMSRIGPFFERKLAKFRMHKVVCFFILSIFFAVFLYANFPAFKGFFVYPEVRVAIPEEYFETFSFFNSQLSYGKIANFPQPTFWGWVNYDWGYRGSGFPWYGVKQPILDRVFDVWSPQTEHYYDQITFALYTKNPTLFKSVLNKYQVKYIWLDERVILPHNPDGLFYPELKQFLVDSTDYKKVFSSGKQSIYEIQFLTNEYFSVNSASSISSTNTDSLYDLTYSTFGDYYSDLSKPASRFVPFANVAYPVSQIPFVTKSDGLYLESSLPTDGYLQYPSASANNTSFWVTALLSGKTLLYDELNPKVLLDGEVVLHSTAGGMIDLSSNTFESGLVLINNVLIQPKVPTALNLFADSNSSVVFNSSTRTYAITSKIKTLELNNCLDFVDNGTKYIYESSSSNEFTLSGTHSRPCKYARIMDIVNLNGFDLGGKRQVVEVSFDYFSPSGEKPTICLSKEGSTKCVYKVGYELTPTTADWDTATFRIYGYDIPLKELWLKYELDASSKDEQLSITFRDLKLRIYQDVLFEDVFSLSQSQIATGDSSNTFLEDTSVMPVKKDQKLDVYLGDFSNANGVYTIYPQDTVANKDCYQLGAGTHAETVGFDKQEGIYVNFLSKDASSCNFYSIPNKYLSSGFLVKIRTKNISGRPLKASIKLDPPGYYFLQEILRVPSNQWEDVYYFVPSVAYSPAQNVFLEIDNYAVGKEVRENYLKNIAIMPVNYNFINTLSVTTEKQASSTVSTNNSVFSVTRLAPFIYKVNVEKLEIPDVKDKSIIFQLNEAFHSGWVMLKGVTVMPNHVISDSWANGWVVEPGSVGEYTAIFVPQALEFLGFFGLFVVCLLLIIRKERLK